MPHDATGEAKEPRRAGLNAAQLEAAKPQSRPYRLNAGGSLFLIVRPSGARSWEFRWRRNGKINATIIGAYPEIGLAKARQGRDRIKAMLAEGRDPAVDKQIAQHEQRERLEQVKQPAGIPGRQQLLNG